MISWCNYNRLLIWISEYCRELHIRKRTELKARLSNKRFYCKSLAGESDYNIVINSDMTVSCNCADFSGDGRIGDFSINTLKEIFNGETAKNFRKQLANGRIPILYCAFCQELTLIPKKDVAFHLTNYSPPHKGIMVENTVRCNLNCLYCNRYSLMSHRKKRRLSLDDIKKVSLEIKRHRIECVNYFNLGEPFLSSTICDELRIIRKDNPDVRIVLSTNGTLMDSDEKREAALLANHIYFSIDGPDDKILQLYQRNGSFKKAFKNMKDLVIYRNKKKVPTPIIEWKYVVFNWNDRPDMIYKAIDLAKMAKINTISFWPGDSPFSFQSKAFDDDGFFRGIGRHSWKGREVEIQ